MTEQKRKSSLFLAGLLAIATLNTGCVLSELTKLLTGADAKSAAVNNGASGNDDDNDNSGSLKTGAIGELDTSFGENGLFTLEINDFFFDFQIAPSSDDSTFLVGHFNADDGTNEIGFCRLTPNGQLDPNFLPAGADPNNPNCGQLGTDFGTSYEFGDVATAADGSLFITGAAAENFGSGFFSTGNMFVKKIKPDGSSPAEFGNSQLQPGLALNPPECIDSGSPSEAMGRSLVIDDEGGHVYVGGIDDDDSAGTSGAIWALDQETGTRRQGFGSLEFGEVPRTGLSCMNDFFPNDGQSEFPDGDKTPVLQLDQNGDLSALLAGSPIFIFDTFLPTSSDFLRSRFNGSDGFIDDQNFSIDGQSDGFDRLSLTENSLDDVVFNARGGDGALPTLLLDNQGRSYSIVRSFDSQNFEEVVFIFRHLANGQRDTTWGGDGIIDSREISALIEGDTQFFLADAQVDSQGRIVVVLGQREFEEGLLAKATKPAGGFVESGPESPLAVVRLLASGAPDPDFGTGGVFLLQIPESSPTSESFYFLTDVKIDANDLILLAGFVDVFDGEELDFGLFTLRIK